MIIYRNLIWRVVQTLGFSIAVVALIAYTITPRATDIFTLSEISDLCIEAYEVQYYAYQSDTIERAFSRGVQRGAAGTCNTLGASLVRTAKNR